jgi:hypothetical protein
VIISSGSAQVVSEGSLPAGNYMISAELQIADNSSSPPTVDCVVYADGTAPANASVDLNPVDGFQELSIVTAAALTNTTNSVGVDCYSTGNSTVASGNLDLVTVDALN